MSRSTVIVAAAIGLPAAGFVLLLAGPGLDDSNLGFVIAVPVGLVLARRSPPSRPPTASRRVTAPSPPTAEGAPGSCSRRWPPGRRRRWVGIGPLDEPTDIERTSGGLVIPALIGTALYLVAAIRYARLGAGAPPGLALAVAVAFVLLGEATLQTALSRNWHTSWWEWHALMLVAFGLVAVTARREWREERFSALYMEETARGKREVSIVFADLAGFTAFSEERDPTEVSEMLNAYFERAIPPVAHEHGGDVERLMGDAIMVTFNARGDQPDHALRAAAAALAIRDTTSTVASENPGWPRFRVGVNTGEALVGVLGATGGRSYTVIGDAVNSASRLESAAPVGEVAIGLTTLRALSGAVTRSLGPIEVKGVVSRSTPMCWRRWGPGSLARVKARLSPAIPALLLAIGVLGGGVARAADTPNPCEGPEAKHLLCPNLKIGKPANLYLDYYGGKALLRATSDVKSRGKGPMELRGHRNGWHSMRVNQRIHRVGGGRLFLRTQASLHFTDVGAYFGGSYWKVHQLAGFTLRRVGPDGKLGPVLRTSPKLNYCLRDLERTRPGRRSPRARHYPGCNQDPYIDAITLGTSVGWSDIYPAPYDKQWIDVSGLRGCFAYEMTVDPKHLFYESNERDNSSRRLVRLPYRGQPGC